MFPKYKALTNEGSIFKSSKVEQKIKTDLFLRRLAAFAYEHLWTSLCHKVVLWQHRGFPLLQRQNFISFDRGNGRKVLGNRCARNRIVKTMTIVITMLCRYSHNRKSWKAQQPKASPFILFSREGFNKKSLAPYALKTKHEYSKHCVNISCWSFPLVWNRHDSCTFRRRPHS